MNVKFKKKDLLTLFGFQFFVLLFSLFSCAETVSCSVSSSESVRRLKIMNWNLETFFDAKFDGNEYSEFKSPKSGWNSEKYVNRLEKLSNMIKEFDADVVVMEELEKESQLQDIANRLSGTFNFAKLYQYGAFAANAGSSIGIGILSRFPLVEISVHSLDIQTEKIEQPAMRPILQTSVLVDGKRIVLFANHWKSKSGGESETDVWRNYQEEQLSRLITASIKQNRPVIASGDFNRDIKEFSYRLNGDNNILLRGAVPQSVYSPWYDSNGILKNPGSYWYKNGWERIDHFFSAGNVKISYFAAENNGEWADEEGHPKKYIIYSGSGYSDHLPITCEVEF